MRGDPEEKKRGKSGESPDKRAYDTFPLGRLHISQVNGSTKYEGHPDT